MTKPFASWPVFEDEEIDAATRVLKSGNVNYWTGNEGRLFEEEFAAFVGTSHAIALANGTVALEVALKALDIGSGDEVVVTSRSFIASASCVVTCGAKPIFADVDLLSHNVTAESISKVLTENTKAIVVVHLMGWPCDMDAIMKLATDRNISVIEDCAQAHGARYNGEVVGSIGHINTFSFCQDKIITTGGEGGMITTNDEQLWSNAWSLKDHGKSYKKVFETDHPPGYRWLHDSFGSNHRMTEMQAAIGRVALRKLPEWLTVRRRNAEILAKGFSSIYGLTVAEPPQNVSHAFYKFYVVVEPEKLNDGWNRDRIQAEINKMGIPCFNTYGGEIYRDTAFANANLMPIQTTPNAEHLGINCLQFLVHPTLDEENMHQTVDTVQHVLNLAT